MTTPDSRHAGAPLGRILVPLDGSEAARRILASRLLCGPDTAVMLVRVLPADCGTRPGDSPLEDAIAELLRARQELAGRGARVGLRVLAGQPLVELERLARVYAPSLVCASLDARTGGRRARDVVDGLVGAAGAPVLVARLRRGETLDVRRVVVPLDGDAASARPLPLAAAIAHRCDAELVLSHDAPEEPAFVRVQRERLGLAGAQPRVLCLPAVEAAQDVRALLAVAAHCAPQGVGARSPLGRAFARPLRCHLLVTGPDVLAAADAEAPHVVCGVD